MAAVDSEVSGFSEEDELAAACSQSSESLGNRNKRRKLNLADRDSTSEVGSFASPDLFNHENHDDKNAEDEEAGQPKPKSKYKIHIPKNSELPTDAFFTQPPRRSSSPYRIDEFHWRKPRKPSPPPPAQSRQQVSLNPHVSTTSASVEVKNGDGRQSKAAIVPLNDPDDEFAADEDYENLLAELPSDAFSSPGGSIKVVPVEPVLISSQLEWPSQALQNQRLAAPLANLRQTTLFGTQAPEANSQSQSTRKHNWPLANREETPTHHKLDREALKTWVYPTNLGTIRDYQYSIVARGLYHNMLVALPTGLGKTFIAATIMLNWFRWTTSAQIVFVAPTKPLVSQQVKACFDIAGIPRSATTMLTGGISPGLRAEEWQTKRVFFMTPQTIVNDLKTGICDPKRLVLLVVDEAHRATGGYAYVEVVKFLRRFNTNFRVLALTATPGASVESVQEVIDGLGISRVEIRTEESLDIRQYVHSRKIDTVLFENSDEMVMVMELFARALQPVLDKLNGMNAYWARDPMTLTPYGCNQARQKWMLSDAGRKAAMPVKGMVNTIFSLLASLSHGIELLKFHGIGPFYHKVLAFRNEIHNNGKKGSKYSNQINECEAFQTMMSRVQIWINNPDFVGHPKLEYLQSVVMNHFLDAGDGRGASDPSSTRVMVFAHYRDSAEEIARVLGRNEPMIRPHVFVGQANSKGSDGMDQKTQLETIKKFQSGIYNTLVATSIGEEGLDIGEVDLIICYDASASPIRMLQRMGRTGRKRAGNIVVTLMKGKEENNFIKAKDSYEKMQTEIAAGTRFNFHDEESKRIVPKDVQPIVDKRVVEIPVENTQPDLPEPKKRGKAPKRPPKKFHMPDGVRTGFMKASRLNDEEDSETNTERRRPLKRRRTKSLSPEPLPTLDEVLLTASQERELERKYLDIKGEASQIVEIPRNNAFPDLQRVLRPTKHVSHGHLTKRIADMLTSMYSTPRDVDMRYETFLSSQDRHQGEEQAKRRAKFFTQSSRTPNSSQILGIDPSQSPRTLGGRSQSAERLPDPAITPIDISSDELEAHSDISNLFDNGMDANLDEASSKSSSPPLERPLRHLPRAQYKSSNNDLDSGDDLPDFSTIAQRVGPKKAVALSQISKRQAVNQRRSARKIVDDDTDDD
ncbi:ATP-dependent DNA helicase MPH1, partial [Lecanoromycetidae sp. Uapishka_2]